MKHLIHRSSMDRPTGTAKGIRTIFSSVLFGAIATSANAAALFSDLVVNGDFENVGTPVGDGAPFTTGWTGGTFGSPSAFTPWGFNYAEDYDNRNGGIVPPGNNGSSSTDYYWAMNANTTDSPGGSNNLQAFQQIDLSTGDTAAQIALGTATFDVSAYFSSYEDDNEAGRLTLEFYDASDVLIGSAFTYDDPNRLEWSLVNGTGAIPIGTSSAVITLGQDPSTLPPTFSPDVYADNVSFTVVPEPSSAAFLVGIFAFFAIIAGRRSRRS